MNKYDFVFTGVSLQALGSGALYWPTKNLLCVSDLHLGKANRMARHGGSQLPPYDTCETLNRLSHDLDVTRASTVICLGDSFDDLTAIKSLPENQRVWITQLQAGRRWIWIEGNHDPGNYSFNGLNLPEFSEFPLTFAHIARSKTTGEVSGHYHPKSTVNINGRSITRPAFLMDENRLIMPAYGTYTGGLRSDNRIFTKLLQETAYAILTGQKPVQIPMPR